MNENILNYLIDKCRTKNIYRPDEEGFIKKLNICFLKKKNIYLIIKIFFIFLHLIYLAT